LPPNWEVRTVPESGQIYYVNIVTKASQWDKPTPEDSELPLNWEKRTDPESGDPYYVNVVTKESTWERPVADSTKANDVTPTSSPTLPATTTGITIEELEALGAPTVYKMLLLKAMRLRMVKRLLNLLL